MKKMETIYPLASRSLTSCHDLVAPSYDVVASGYRIVAPRYGVAVPRYGMEAPGDVIVVSGYVIVVVGDDMVEPIHNILATGPDVKTPGSDEVVAPGHGVVVPGYDGVVVPRNSIVAPISDDVVCPLYPIRLFLECSSVALEEVLQLREASHGCSSDGPALGDPHRRDAAARLVAVHAFPAAARVAGPRGAEEDAPVAEVPSEAPQCAEVIGVARRRARRWQEERREEQQQPAARHGLS